MAAIRPIRAVLMSAEIRDSGSGFHRLTFKVEGGRSGMANVAVMISQDAHRKVSAQLSRARAGRFERDQLLKTWARWAISLRIEDLGVVPATITVTASDVDEFGAYALELATLLQAS